MPEPIYVACGAHGLRMVSRDGTTWSEPTIGEAGEVCRGAAVGGGRIVTVGTRGGTQIFASSPDGTTWETTTRDGGYAGYVRTVDYLGGRFLALGGDAGAVGNAKPYLIESDDGITWSENRPIAGTMTLRRVAFGGGTYVGVGDRGRRSWSDNGRDWTDIDDVKAIETLVDVAYGAGRFVGVGLHGLRMTTDNGREWSEPTRGEEGEHLNGIVFTGGRFVAVGSDVTLTSDDGRTWTRHETGDAPLAIAAGRTLVGARWRGRLFTSPDGIAWKQTHRAEHHVEAVAAGTL